METKSKAHWRRSGYTIFVERVLQNKFFGQFPFWSSQNNLKNSNGKIFCEKRSKIFPTTGHSCIVIKTVML